MCGCPSLGIAVRTQEKMGSMGIQHSSGRCDMREDEGCMRASTTGSGERDMREDESMSAHHWGWGWNMREDGVWASIRGLGGGV